MKYYTQYSNVALSNFWRGIGFIETASLCGANVPCSEHIVASFTPGDNDANPGQTHVIHFHTEIGKFIDGSGPFFTGKFLLAGHDIQTAKKVWAILEVDLAHSEDSLNNKVTVSPVPFGMDGTPKLPYRDENMEMFLFVVRALVLYSSKFINGEQLRKEMIPKLLNASRHYDFWEVTAAHWLNETDKLGITCDRGDKGHEIMMIPQEFEQNFGVNLCIHLLPDFKLKVGP